MAVSSDSPVTYRGRSYCGAERIGFDAGTFVVALYTTPLPEPRGSYFTTLPISKLGYRRQIKTQARAVMDGAALVVFDDWGYDHRIEAAPETIAALVMECRDQELM